MNAFTAELIRQLKEDNPNLQVISASELGKVRFAEVQHADGCLCKTTWNMADCTCKPDVVVHTDAARHQALVMSRKQQRKAKSKAYRK